MLLSSATTKRDFVPGRESSHTIVDLPGNKEYLVWTYSTSQWADATVPTDPIAVSVGIVGLSGGQIGGIVTGTVIMFLIMVCAFYSGFRLCQQKAKEKYGISIDMPAADYLTNVSR